MPEGNVPEPIVTVDNPGDESTPDKGGDTILTGAPTDETETSDTPLAPEAPALPKPWMSGLSEDLRADETALQSLSKFDKGLPDVSKAYLELEKRIGTTVRPGEAATEAEWDTWREANDVPKNPDGYKLKTEPPALPEGMELDEKMLSSFLEFAHKSHMPDAEASALYSFYLERFVPQIQAATKAATESLRVVKTTQEEAISKLKTDLGDGYTRGMNLMNRAFATWGNDDVANILETTGLGNHPAVVKMFIDMAAQISEDRFIDPRSSNGAGAGNPVGQRTMEELANAAYPSQTPGK